MRARLLLAGAVAALGLALSADQGRAAPDDYVQVERGRYLATVGDCIACHTGPAGQYAGGRAIETPFGDIYAANLTPDNDTGIGLWSAEDFRRAMHEGRGRHGTRLYPAFPYPYYTRVTREDTDAIYAFLRTLEPVRNPVDRSALPFPLDIRLAMLGWNTLFFTPEEFRPDPQRSAEYNRGAYLVEGLGHCGACHTPKNFLGADSGGQALAGGELQGWYAPALTNDARTGLGRWSIDDIVAYLRDGRNAHSTASGPMAEVVGFSTSLMREDDLRAMAVYLKERPDQPAAAPPPAPDPARMRVGEALYVDNCIACHRRDGTGVEQMIPRLAGSAVVQQGGPETLLRVVLQGVRGVATKAAPTAPAMPAFGWRLNDAQVADLVTYLRSAWGNAAPAVTPDQARQMRQRLQTPG
ncbi:cytochrome c [Roseomonas sp. OT10]|uniref:c-type cytochrome n=1 Tax=Roseomonas cutis TaxID=2897332 RepID=UPI001E570927|nr:cytochrome c [Roseomonas sp. OT10]UFN50293.1 cytochrome c [Roseomonas sp. OT10]